MASGTVPISSLMRPRSKFPISNSRTSCEERCRQKNPLKMSRIKSLSWTSPEKDQRKSQTLDRKSWKSSSRELNWFSIINLKARSRNSSRYSRLKNSENLLLRYSQKPRHSRLKRQWLAHLAVFKSQRSLMVLKRIRLKASSAILNAKRLWCAKQRMLWSAGWTSFIKRSPSWARKLMPILPT